MILKILKTLRFTFFKKKISLRSLIIGNVKIGNDVSVGPYSSILTDEKSSIEIKNNVSIGAKCRLIARNGAVILLDENSSIQRGTSITAPHEKSGKFYLGKYSAIHKNNHIDITDNVILEEEVRTGIGTFIHTHKHSLKGKGLIWKNTIESSEVIIKKGSWIGTYCQLMPGSGLGNGSVLAAGGILTKKFGDFKVVAGNPATVIKER